MTLLLKPNAQGGYRYLTGIEPYSSGVVSAEGHEIVHVRLEKSVAWHSGLLEVRRYLEQLGLSRFALCGVELRCPTPFSMSGFIEFNRGYRRLLEDWDLLVEGDNPVARTNVAPRCGDTEESKLFGFSYSQPSDYRRPTFVVAGGGELVGVLKEEGIVRRGETSEDAMMEKAGCVIDLMNQRLNVLEAEDAWLSAIDVYSIHPLRQIYTDLISTAIPAANRIGLTWFDSRPPVQDIEFEMDMRGVVCERVLKIG